MAKEDEIRSAMEVRGGGRPFLACGFSEERAWMEKETHPRFQKVIMWAQTACASLRHKLHVVAPFDCCSTHSRQDSHEHLA